MSPTFEALENRSVLVLDDEESIRMLLTEGFGAHGVKVDCAASAEQALSLIFGHKYDVDSVRSEIVGQRTKSDGHNVSQRLRVAAGANKPEVIFMSGDVWATKRNPRSTCRSNCRNPSVSPMSLIN